MPTSAIANAGCIEKIEDIATKQHSVWRTKIQFQNPALAIARAVVPHFENRR